MIFRKRQIIFSLLTVALTLGGCFYFFAFVDQVFALTEPVQIITARMPIKTVLPEDKTVMAQEKAASGGAIIERRLPPDYQIPSPIFEEKIPSQVELPEFEPASVPVVYSSAPNVSSETNSVSTNPNSNSSSDQTLNSNTNNNQATTTPFLTLASFPASLTTSSSAIFVFSSSNSDGQYLCRLDDASSTPCVSPQEYQNLNEGGHIFKIWVADAAGSCQEPPVEYDWAIDFSAPVVSDIAAAPARTSSLVSWISSEPGVFQIEYGVDESYGFISATTSLAALKLAGLSFNTQYHFRILAQDLAGNATSSEEIVFNTTAQAENVVISEIQISGATADDEFVELYNPTLSDINLSGWRLTRKSYSGATVRNLLNSFPDKFIPAHSYFLIAYPFSYDGGVAADVFYSSTSSSYSIASSSSVILYSDAGRTIVDMVGLGIAENFEGAATVNPGKHQSIERKALATSTAELLFDGEHQFLGNGYDTDNNADDFVIQNTPNPQNSLMDKEPTMTPP